MRRQVVKSQLLRVDHSLSLTHTLEEDTKEPRQSGDRTPAVLVIPRGGNLREPHLVTLESIHGPCDAGAPARIITDPHTVMCIDEVGDGPEDHQSADVIVQCHSSGYFGSIDQAPRPPGRALDCDIAVSHLATWSMLRLRGNEIVEINGPAALLARATSSWLAVYGSVVHCWLAADLPIDILGDAVVAVGYYHVGTSARDYRFSVAGRAYVFVHPIGSAAARTRVE